MAQNSSSRHIPNRSEYTCASNDTYRNIHSNINIVSTNWKLPKCLSVDGIRKFVVYSSNGINTMWYGKPWLHLTDKMLSKSKHNDIQQDFIYKKALNRNQISGDRSQNNYCLQWYVGVFVVFHISRMVVVQVCPLHKLSSYIDVWFVRPLWRGYILIKTHFQDTFLDSSNIQMCFHALFL